MTVSSKRLKGIFALAIVTALWGLSFPVVKNAIQNIPPFLFNALRFDVASLFLIALILIKRRHFSVGSITSGLAMGVPLFFGYSFQTFGLMETSATNSAFLTALNVVFVPLFGVFLGIRLQPKVALGVLVATMGLWFLTGSGAASFNRGDLLTIFCAIGFAIQILLISKSRATDDIFVLTAFQMVAVAIGSHFGNLIFEVDHSLPSSSVIWANLIFAGIFLSAIPFVIQIQVQRFVSAVTAAMVFATEPLWGAVAAYVLNGERLAFFGYLGGALLIFGILIVEAPPLPRFLKVKLRPQ